MDNTETHQKGKLKDAQMVKIKEALGIKNNYYLGKGFEYYEENEQKIKKDKIKHKLNKRKKE